MSHTTPKIVSFCVRTLWWAAAVMALCLTSVSPSPSSANANQAYYIHVGMVVLRSGALADAAQGPEFFVTVRRDNLAVKRQLAKNYDRRTDLRRNYVRLSKKITGTDPENVSKLKSLRELRDAVTDELVPIDDERKRLLSLLVGRTLAISNRKDRIDFADMKVPVKVYAGDTVTISVTEDSQFLSPTYSWLPEFNG